MKVKRFFRLLAIYAKMDLAWLLRDAKTVLLMMLAELIGNGASAMAMFALAWRFDGIGGMGRYEVLFMMGYLILSSGLHIIFCAQNNGAVSRVIGRGQLDHFMIQPLPLSTQLLTMGFAPFTGMASPLIGAGILAFALNKLQIAVTWWWLLALAGSLIVSVAIPICLSYLAATVAFYAPVAAEEISMYVMDAGSELGKYPLSGMPKSLAIPLLTVFPSGLIGWFPVMALLGKPPLGLPAVFPLLVGIPLYLVTRIIFRRGMRHYARDGSIRYVPHGFRC